MSPPRTAYRPPAPATLAVEDFGGGWNPADAPGELAPNESPDTLNFTMDQRGGAVKRLGLQKVIAGELGTVAMSNGFASNALGMMFAQSGAGLYKLSGGAWTLKQTFSSSARVGFCDFQTIAVVIHPVDGVFTSADGNTWTHAAASPPGYGIQTWRNKLWALGDPANPATLTYSANGSATDWAGTGSGANALREKDALPLTCLTPAGGIDQQGDSGLLVAKGGSIYRVVDAATGAYQTLDPDYGAAGPLAMCTIRGMTAIVSGKGVALTDGTQKPKLVDKLSPLFNDQALALANAGDMVATVIGERMLFSMRRAGAAYNDLTLEVNPDTGAAVPHDFGMAWAAPYTIGGAQRCYAGSRSRGFLVDVFRGGVDDDDNNAARPIACHYQTRWWVPGADSTQPGAAGHECRLIGGRVRARGAFNLFVRTNQSIGAGRLYAVSALDSNVWVWGTDVWGDPTKVWGPASFEKQVPVMMRDRGHAFAFRVEQTGSSSTTEPPLLGSGAALPIGEVALYGVTADYVQLGLAGR